MPEYSRGEVPQTMSLGDIEIERVKGTKALVQMEYIQGKSNTMLEAEMNYSGSPFSPATIREIEAVGGIVTERFGHTRVRLMTQPARSRFLDAEPGNAVPITAIEVSERDEDGETRVQRIFTVPELYTHAGNCRRQIFLPFPTWEHVLTFCENAGLYPVPDEAAQALRQKLEGIPGAP